MYKGKRRFIIQTIVIAAIYVVLTLIANMFGMANGIIQVRISDALCVLPYYTGAAIPGLFIGCLIANTITGTITADIIYGSLATLVGAILSFALRKYKFAVPFPPIIVNMFVIPLIFTYAYRFEGSFWKFVLTIGIGELVSCGVLGTALLLGLEDSRSKLFPVDGEEPVKEDIETGKASDIIKSMKQ